MGLREAADKATVVSVDTVHLRRGEILFPELPEGSDKIDEVWMVSVRVKPNNAAPVCSIQYFPTVEHAKKHADLYPVGREVSTEATGDEIWQNLSRLASEVVDGELALFARAGDEELYLPWQVLRDAEISNPNGTETSQEVRNFLGKGRIGELKSRFGENWEAAAEFEFCVANLPHTSPAFVAAACRFNYFIQQDDFSAGYRLRHLEALIYGDGIDGDGAKALRRAARAGGLARSATFEQSREEILEAMRKMVEDGLSVSRASELAAARGLGTSPEANRKIWQRYCRKLGQ